MGKHMLMHRCSRCEEKYTTRWRRNLHQFLCQRGEVEEEQDG